MKRKSQELAETEKRLKVAQERSEEALAEVKRIHEELNKLRAMSPEEYKNYQDSKDWAELRNIIVADWHFRQGEDGTKISGSTWNGRKIIKKVLGATWIKEEKCWLSPMSVIEIQSKLYPKVRVISDEELAHITSLWKEECAPNAWPYAHFYIRAICSKSTSLCEAELFTIHDGNKNTIQDVCDYCNEKGIIYDIDTYDYN